MNYILQIKKIIRKTHFNENGEIQKAVLSSELTPSELIAFKNKLPNSTLPKDIEKLISFTRGIKFHKL